MKPYALRAAIKRADGVWWRTLAYCESCGVRMGITKRAAWCRIRIRLPEFRRNAICPPCAKLLVLGLLRPSYPWWYPNRPGWTLPSWSPKDVASPIFVGDRLGKQGEL